MASSIKKRGQKLVRRLSQVTREGGAKGSESVRRHLIDRISHVRSVRLLVLEWGLLVVALIMLALTQAFWFSDSYTENTFTSGGTYTEATIGEVNSLNPLFATTSSEKTLSKLMFATVSTIDYSGHVGNQIAKSITPSDNGKKWTVVVRDDIKWSDGEALTAEDVFFTMELIKNPAVSTIYDLNLANIKVSLDESGAVVFDLPVPYADFASALNIPVVPKHILSKTDPKVLAENSFSTEPITSGAFTFNAMQTNSTSGEKIYFLSANQDYYQGKPLLNSFAIHTYANKSSIVSALNNGEVTATAELSDADADKITSTRFIEKNSSLNSGAFLFFNLSRNVVSDQSLRSAIREGLNLERLRETIPETVALDYPLLDSQIELSSYPSLTGYNLENAKNRISEIAGDGVIHLDIATVNSGYLPNVTNTIADMLRELGIEVNVTTYEENQEFINTVLSRRNYDILVYEVELGADPDLLPYYHSSQATSSGLNLSNYKSAIADDLLIGARDTIDRGLRIKKYESFLQHWVTDVPAIGLYRSNLTYYYNKNVRTFGNDVRLVSANDRFSDISNWAVNKATKNKTP